VFVTGVELSIMNQGFMPGDSVDERLGLLLSDPDRRRERLAEVSTRINDFLGTAVAAVRERFRGRVTYAAIPVERVDWTPFDIMSVELIRSAEVAGQFREGVRRLVAGGKPVAITGFGTAAYRGAGDRGGRVMEILEYDKDTVTPVRLDGEYARDETGQATYLRELLEILDAEGVDGAFVFLFALESFPYRPDGDPVSTWTWPAWASSRCWRAAAETPTPTWPGNPRSPSPPSPSATAADHSIPDRNGRTSPDWRSSPTRALSGTGSSRPLSTDEWRAGDSGWPARLRAAARRLLAEASENEILVGLLAELLASGVRIPVPPGRGTRLTSCPPQARSSRATCS
jgi:hypothetical protein